MNELNRIEEEKQKGDRNKMFDKGYKNRVYFTKFETIRTSGDSIKNAIIKMNKQCK